MSEITITVPDGEYCEGCKYNMYHGPDRKCRLLFEEREMKERSPGAWYHIKCPACIEAIKEGANNVS